MRISSALILTAVILSILSPVSSHVFISSAGETNYFIAFDVCDTGGSLVPSCADVPSLLEHLCSPEPFETVEYIEPINPSFSPSWYFVQLEHPPKS